jgi:hypothetical protein
MSEVTTILHGRTPYLSWITLTMEGTQADQRAVNLLLTFFGTLQ